MRVALYIVLVATNTTFVTITKFMSYIGNLVLNFYY